MKIVDYKGKYLGYTETAWGKTSSKLWSVLSEAHGGFYDEPIDTPLGKALADWSSWSNDIDVLVLAS